MNVECYIGEKVNSTEMNEQAFFNTEQITFNIRCNSLSLLESIKQSYRPFLCDDSDPDMTFYLLDGDRFASELEMADEDTDPFGTKCRFNNLEDGRLISNEKNDVTFAFGSAGNLVIGSCESNPDIISQFIDSRLVDSWLHRGNLPLKAAGVSMSGKGIAISSVNDVDVMPIVEHLLASKAILIHNNQLLAERQSETMRMISSNPGRVSESAIISSELNGIVLLELADSDEPLKIKTIKIARKLNYLTSLMASPDIFFFPMSQEPELDFSPMGYVGLIDCPVYLFKGGYNMQAVTDECITILQSAIFS